MAKTASQAFPEFAAKIKPTAAQRQTIQDRRERVRKILRDLFPASSNMPLQDAYLIGSAARGTIIRPIEDIDVFAIFDDRQVWPNYQFDSRGLLYRVRDALNTKYSATVVGARGQAVRLFYKQTPHVDIAPAFAVTGGNGWVIPAGDRRWIQTDPFLHNRFLDRRNKELDGHLKPLIRLLKRWNAVHSRRFRSFHLEMVAQQCFASMSGSMRYGLRGFFNWAQSRLDVADPAGYSGNLAAGWSWAHRSAVLNSLATSYERAQRAIEAEKGGKHSEAMRLWRVLLGNEFPAYG